MHTPLRAAALAVLLSTLAACGGADGKASADPPRRHARPQPVGTAPPPQTPTTEVPPLPMTVDERAYSGRGPRVLVIGDSISVAGSASLRRHLTNVSLKVQAWRGEGMSGGPFSHAFGQKIVRDVGDREAPNHPSVVVIAIGTNDAWNPKLGLTAYAAGWERLQRQFASSCIVGVTVTERSTAPRYDRGEARAINRLIRRDSDVVADWGRIGNRAPYLTSDEIHPTVAGRERHGQVVAGAVRTCLRNRR